MGRTDQIISHFPDFYRSGDSENLFYGYIGVFAGMLDMAEEDLIRVMRTHWVNTADNEGSKGFDTTEKGDLDKILALYLESLGGTALLKQGTRRPGPGGKPDDDLYRTRILGLIQVLKNGASTRAGIIDIVAANLGILPDLPYATIAHDSIHVIEYLPETVSAEPNPKSVKLYQDFTVNNRSPLAVVPELWLIFPESLSTSLVNPRIINPVTGDSISYSNNGTVTPGNTLYFLSGPTGLYRGGSFDPQGDLTLPSGQSTLRFEAQVGVPAGFFDKAFFDYSQFDTPTLREIGIFDKGSFFDSSVFTYTEPVVELEVFYQRLFPGSFTVLIPWDIPGFSANITLTQHTLDRLTLLGLTPTILDALQPLLNQEYETREAFFAALPPLVKTETGSITLNRKNISQLNLFSVPTALVNKLLTLLNSGLVSFPHLEALFEGLGVDDEKTLYGALGILLDAGSPLEVVLRECMFTDKFARFSISPRGQIKTIVDRVKAAGIYAVIAFEKRFFEDHQMTERPGLVFNWATYDQEMTESDFNLASTQNASEQQEMSDLFSLSGIFDYTRFDTLNTYA